MRPSVAAELERLSSEEMTAALGLAHAPPPIRRLAAYLFSLPSKPLARALSRFNQHIQPFGLDKAARFALRELGARLSILPPEVRLPKNKALLVVSNHPGAYDALALMAALGRPDLMILAADRTFLRALSAMEPHFIFFPLEAEDNPRSLARVSALRKAIRHLNAGGAVLHFPAGRIEPDPAFLKNGEDILSFWKPGAGILARAAAAAGGELCVAVVSGVHSARAKGLWISRMAEKKGITTLAPLIAVAVPGFSDVHVRIRFSAPKDAALWTVHGRDDAGIAMELKNEAYRLANIL